MRFIFDALQIQDMKVVDASNLEASEIHALPLGLALLDVISVSPSTVLSIPWFGGHGVRLRTLICAKD